jgi:hypothetical protein
MREREENLLFQIDFLGIGIRRQNKFSLRTTFIKILISFGQAKKKKKKHNKPQASTWSSIKLGE